MQYDTVPPSRAVVGHRWSWWDRKRYRSNCMNQDVKDLDCCDQVYLDEIVSQLAEAESPTTTHESSVIYNTDEIINLMPSHQALISDVGFTLTRKHLYSNRGRQSSYDTYRTISQYGGGPSSSRSSSNRGHKQPPRSKSAKHVMVNLTSDERAYPVLVTDSQSSLNREEHELVEIESLQAPQFFNPVLEESVEIPSAPREVFSQESVSKRSETIRRMPSSMPIKRKFRAQFYRRQVSQLSSLMKFTYYFVKEIKRFSTNFDEFIQRFGLWNNQLKTIEGNYGTNVLAYFTFVRLLFLLNSFTAFLFICFVIIPGSVRNFDSCRSNRNSLFINSTDNFTNGHLPADCYQIYCEDVEKENFIQSVADFFKGTGWMSDKLLFIGTYQSCVKLSDGRRAYNLNLAYMLITLIFLVVSLISMVLSTGRGIKYAIVTPDDRYQKYFSKLFAGWDYCIRNSNMAYLKRKILRRDIVNELTFENDQQRRQKRNEEELWHLYFRRFLILCLNFVLIVGSFVIIYFTTDSALKYANKDRRKALSPFVSLIFEYMPSMTITALNFVVPFAFHFLTPFEDYPPGIEIRLALINLCRTADCKFSGGVIGTMTIGNNDHWFTSCIVHSLSRTVFLRLASVIVLVLTVILQTMQCDIIVSDDVVHRMAFFSGQQIFVDDTIVKITSWSICGELPQCKCWETYMGQQLYKLAILDFFVTIFMTFCVDFPRKIFVNRWSNRLTRLVGRQKFELPPNVLDIVYVQTICWLGCFYCPFLPLITCAKILIVFYLKWFALDKIYDLSFKPYKTTKTHAFFVSILMISFFVSIATFGFVVAKVKPSSFCGPFRSLSTIWLVFIEFIDDFPRNLRRFIQMFGHPPFNLLIFFVLSLSGFYYHAVAVANKNLVRHLKSCLIYEGRDRLFLVENINKRANGNVVQQQRQ